MDFETRLAAYVALTDEHDRVLLVRWKGHRGVQWTVPGGGVQFEETCEQGAVREAYEETGYRVELGDLLGVDTVIIPSERRISTGPGPLKGIRVIYRARIVGGHLRHETDGSTDMAQWLSRAEIADLPRVELVDTMLAWLDR